MGAVGTAALKVMSEFRVKVYHKGIRSNFLKSFVNLLQNENSLCENRDDEVKVNFSLQSDRLLISCEETPGVDFSEDVILHRPQFCPFKRLPKERESEIPSELKQRGVDVGVALLLESSDQHVLLTRRSSNMRTFPRVWVPPGGHIDEGETLSESVFRELKEETNISVNSSETKVLGLYESTYPPYLEWGLPKRHHIVVYLHCKTKETSSEINKNINLQIDETDACVWLSKEVAMKIINGECQSNSSKNDFENLTGANVVDGLTQVTSHMDIKSLRFSDNTGSHSNGSERISTGTKYALKIWLQQFK